MKLATYTATSLFMVASFFVADVHCSAQSDCVAAINKNRAAAGLKPVCLNSKLSAVASSYSSTLGNGPLDHDKGTNFGSRLSAAGFATTAENLGTAGYSPEGVVDAWMASPQHHANMMNPQYNMVGIGAEAGGAWVADFAFQEHPQCDDGSSPSAPPSSSSTSTTAPAGSPSASPASNPNSGSPSPDSPSAGAASPHGTPSSVDGEHGNSNTDLTGSSRSGSSAASAQASAEANALAESYTGALAQETVDGAEELTKAVASVLSGSQPEPSFRLAFQKKNAKSKARAAVLAKTQAFLAHTKQDLERDGASCAATSSARARAEALAKTIATASAEAYLDEDVQASADALSQAIASDSNGEPLDAGAKARIRAHSMESCSAHGGSGASTGSKASADASAQAAGSGSSTNADAKSSAANAFAEASAEAAASSYSDASANAEGSASGSGADVSASAEASASAQSQQGGSVHDKGRRYLSRNRFKHKPQAACLKSTAEAAASASASASTNLDSLIKCKANGAMALNSKILREQKVTMVILRTIGQGSGEFLNAQFCREEHGETRCVEGVIKAPNFL